MPTFAAPSPSTSAQLPPDVPRYLTIKATAARLGYSAQTVAMMIQVGRLPAVNIATRPGKTEACYRILADAVPH